ncbi:MAG: antibiotic biosynthesis monooxygenase [Planctomycetaceae bacterium]|nr:antibiotic biosynthesis monooxygenase [Planctomycetaceae bacterium]
MSVIEPSAGTGTGPTPAPSSMPTPTPTSPSTGDPAPADRHDAPPVAEQVSFIIEHKVRPGHQAEYEKWLHTIITEAGKYHGHLGAHVAKPPPGGDTYVISVRFAEREDALHWMNSDTRKHLMAQARPHIAGPEHLKILSGIDYWFTPATGGVSPPRWKQWLTTVSAIWPIAILLPHILKHLFQAVPALGRVPFAQLISTMITVGLLVYVIMPRYSRLIARWLSKK